MTHPIVRADVYLAGGNIFPSRLHHLGRAIVATPYPMDISAELSTASPGLEHATQLPPDILLFSFTGEPNVPVSNLVFDHTGRSFKGTDTTFGSFPSRLEHVLSETIENVAVRCTVFPAYETKGDLDKAVERFADWLTTLAVEKEVAHGGGAGKAKIVLCGHSMGGLLIADSLLAFVHTRPDPAAPIWPNIIACLAFDTPYFGLHPHVFKNSATKAAGYAQTAHKVATDAWDAFNMFRPKAAGVTSTTPPVGLLETAQEQVAPGNSWSKWAPAAYSVGGALLAGAAAGTAFYKRDELGSGYAAVLDHMKYVGNLWDDKALGARVDKLVKIEEDHGVVFRTFYTAIPPNYSSHTSTRTFIILPTASSIASHFQEAQNSMAADEVQAHVGMFEPSTNDGYYRLGLEVASIVRDALMKGRGVVESKKVNMEKVTQQSEEMFGHAAEEEAIMQEPLKEREKAAEGDLLL
ncbi:hypothetical protein OF83DRAFT_1177073 [Amylostereum chailletii]|nr:hypothetical protein OF83DRAFT_1177073 [Amylostereum chailletii]